MNYKQFQAINTSHDGVLMEREFIKAEGYIKLIEKARKDIPTDGDVLELVLTKYNKTYKSAHIEDNGFYENELSYCEEPYTPFVTKSGKCGASGGAWGSIPKAGALEYLGKVDKLFWTWEGLPRANGGMYFIAKVNKWRMVI